MDNNMNAVDFNNMQNGNQQVPNMPQQPMNPNIGPQMPEQPVNPNMGPQMPQQPMNPNMGPQMPQGTINGDVPVINVEQTPTEIFGQQVNQPQPNDPTQMNQMLESINQQQQPEQPKYGYATNEQKPDLNADSNVNLKVVIFLAILIFAFIMALPYLSSLLDK